MKQANFLSVFKLIFFALLTARTASAETQTNPYPVTGITPSSSLYSTTRAEKLEFGSFCTLAAAVAASFFAYIQYRVASKTWAMQATLANLEQTRLRLETLLRGKEMPLGQQSMHISQSEDEDKLDRRKAWIVSQICENNGDEERKRWAKELVDEWFTLERKLNEATARGK